MPIDSSEKYTLFFLALCTLCLTTTIIIYCHHADHVSKEESFDEVKAQVDVLRERVSDLLFEIDHGTSRLHHSISISSDDKHTAEGDPALAVRPPKAPSSTPNHHQRQAKVDRRKVYATLYHNTANDIGYVWGLRVMIHSARAAGCRQPFVVMHLMTFEQVEQSLGREVVRELMEADVLFRQIEGVEKVFGSGAFAHIAKSRWQVAINKVRVWEMTEFDKVLFIDLDSVVLKNLDFLFAFPELTASNDQAALDKMRTYEILNPGFMLVHPNASTFQQFVEFSHRLNTEDSVMSTAEQGMLISLYPHPVLLPNTFAMTPAAAPLLIDQEFGWSDVFSLHFYDTETVIVPKPWTVPYPLTPSGKGHHWDVAFALWWQARQRLVASVETAPVVHQNAHHNNKEFGVELSI